MQARGLPDNPVALSEPESLFNELSGYLKPEDISQLKNAYLFSQSAHSGQFRKSGEPYISHPLAVTSILGRLHLDIQTLTAALLPLEQIRQLTDEMLAALLPWMPQFQGRQ